MHLPNLCVYQFLLYFFYYYFFRVLKKIAQSGGASRWRVCYHRGLLRLV